jgi:hypothetical protein
MLPTKLGSFGQAVSEEKIFLGIDQSASRTACGDHVCKDCSFSPDPLANMVGTGNSCC